MLEGNEEDKYAPEVTLPAPPSLPLGLRLGKDVSVGEYDCATGLTFVTRQRGRLHFHMGVNAVRLSHATTSLDSEVATDVTATAETAPGEAVERPHDATGASVPPLRTGAFTGLALFAEEAFFLMQRGALVVWELLPPPAEETMATPSNSSSDRPLDAAQFVTLLLRDRRASLPCLHAYVALKENQFHPRRHESRAGGAVVLAQPQHYAGDGSACPIAFDVWKSSTETVYVPNEDYAAVAAVTDAVADAEVSARTDTQVSQQQEGDAVLVDAGRDPRGAADESESSLARLPKRRAKKDKRVKKRKVRRLRLAFRVVVCRYADAAPPSARLRCAALAPWQSAAADQAVWQQPVPVKLAVVDQDRSVLFFEVGAPSCEELQNSDR